MKDNQKKTILNHLKTRGRITNIQAVDLYKITCLQERIRDIRRAGIPVEKVWMHRKRDDGKNVRYAEYYIPDQSAQSGN